jgi:hypothetical protein
MKLNITLEISEEKARKMIEACGFEVKQVEYTDWVKMHHNRLEPKKVKADMVEIGGRHLTIEDALRLLYNDRITEHIMNEIEKGL